MSLDERIERIAQAPTLLVASDYDGTLAPIVADPAAAVPLREAVVALQRLAELPHTFVAVISGRALSELARLSGLPPSVRLVGSHGSEFDPDFARTLPPELVARRDALERELEHVAADAPGALVERKPAGVAFHYRNAERGAAERALARLYDGPASAPDVHVKEGKEVLELALVRTHKGEALERLRGLVGAGAVAFFGDDVTDEDAFRTLGGPDLAIKVGPGATAAPERVDDVEDVARLLARLCELRSEWLTGGDAVPIEEHALLSDQRALALVTPDARVAWLCLPRADLMPVFAELVGGRTAGGFAVLPADGSPPLGQRYDGDSLVLETAFRDFTVLDVLDASDGRSFRRAGRSDLLRIVRGRGRVRIEFAPRLDFGRMPALLEVEPDGLRVLGGPDPLVLRAPGVAWALALEAGRTVARAEVELKEGADLALELRYGTGNLGPARSGARERADATREFWARWAGTLELPPVATAAVRRSALALKALCHGPSGAILAAATTSLPEHLGGVRNWDYRFCWPRDASLAAAALVRLGKTYEAMAFLDWLIGVCETLDSPSHLRPLYAVDRGAVHAEAEIPEMSGYRGSRPVRVGNTAVHQVQLDVFGPIVDLVARLSDHGAPLSSEHWRLVEGMVEAVAERWREPDHGIWEERVSPRHHVYSRIMCWTCADRGARLARSMRGRARPEWEALADEIKADVLAHGFDARRQAFTGAYGEAALDAAALHVGLSGLVDADDPRFVATVAAVERELRDGPTVYRYKKDDGLPGGEGGFHLCAGWLVEAYLRVGRARDARELFDAWTALAGPTGLLSEQHDPHADVALGNHPQAYSHTALIENACSLAECGDGGGADQSR